MEHPPLAEHLLLSDREQLIEAITKLLTDLLSETRSIPREATAFDCKQVPGIGIREYLRRRCGSR